ncbi:MAG: hypothetical protein AAGM22_03665 [Acidobacteriota bacterium]
MIDLSKLNELKTLIQTAEKFSEPWEFFFDHFGDHREFMDHGKPVKSVLLTELCKTVAKKVYGNAAGVTNRQWVYLKPQRFLHGTALLDGQLAVAIYFTDIEMGMLSFQTLRGSQLMRFTAHGVKNRELNFPAPSSRAVN